MTAVSLPVERFARSPELATLAILDTALLACETALLAVHPELAHGALDVCPRGASPMRAHSILVATRRLATAIATYREALGREERAARKNQDTFPF